MPGLAFQHSVSTMQGQERKGCEHMLVNACTVNHPLGVLFGAVTLCTLCIQRPQQQNWVRARDHIVERGQLAWQPTKDVLERDEGHGAICRRSELLMWSSSRLRAGSLNDEEESFKSGSVPNRPERAEIQTFIHNNQRLHG